MTDIVDRLRDKRALWSQDRIRWYMSGRTDSDCNEAADTIEAMRLADKGRRAEVAMLKDDIIALRARIEELWKDAARYRWAIAEVDNADALYFAVINNARDAADIGRDIDAAMSAATPSPNAISTSAGPAAAGD